ncbi:hypothetical protein ACFWN5_43200 [Streptomyces sp. NPDC058430]|uniref:hypothetical protein n=1 Tax=unclassified Streptomyces TaxID=2593676 RepID=UPI00363852DC
MPGRKRDHLLAVAGIAEQGVDVSLRDIARRAGEGCGLPLRDPDVPELDEGGDD